MSRQRHRKPWLGGRPGKPLTWAELTEHRARRLVRGFRRMGGVSKHRSRAGGPYVQPNIAGSTDSSQRMLDYVMARKMDLPKGEVDKFRYTTILTAP